MGGIMEKIKYNIQQNQVRIVLDGDYTGYDDISAVQKITAALDKKSVNEVNIDASALGRWDSTLVVVLYEICKIVRRRSLKMDLSSLPKNLRQLLNLAFSVDRKPEKHGSMHIPFLVLLGAWGMNIYASVKKGLNFIRQSLRSFARLFTYSAIMRKVDFLFALGDCTYRAVGIVSLVSFMVGLILAFVGAIQLKTFGAQIYVASLVAIAMTRIMGAIMVGIIMAGRTGASYAATIGTMQVNEEVDALKTMGIPTADFLVLPRILALTIAMPFLTLLADLMGILGGAAVGVMMLGIPYEQYIQYTMDALNMTNFWVGIFHGFIFGIIIALCGCYYGINSGRNADSVGVATTRAVVSAIVWMIVLTGIITWIFEVLGI